MQRHKGFTLIELMIAVVAVAILAAIAFPSYQGQLRKSRRGSAQAFMMDVAQREQARFLDARSFVQVAADNVGPANGITSDDNENFPGALGIAPPPEITDLYVFRVDLTGPPPGFSITAEAKGSQTDDGNLVLTSAGAKTRGGDPAKW